MKCPKCSEESPEELNFCRRCGARLVPHDPEATSKITKRMITDEAVVFPTTGSRVVPVEKNGKEPQLYQYVPLVWPKRPVEYVPSPAWPTQSYTLPEDSLSFTIDPTLFDTLPLKAFEPRGLLRLKETYTEKGPGFRLGEPYIPDKEIQKKNIELLFAKNKSFKENNSIEWRFMKNPKTVVTFDVIESVVVKRRLLKATFIVKLKPEKTVKSFQIDPIIRELTLHISYKDVPLARKLQSAVMYELSTAKLQGFLGG